MATITAASVVTANGTQVLAHPHGNNAAIICPKCGRHPVLLIARENQVGSDKKHPSKCGGCQAEVWITSVLTDRLQQVVVDFS